jgi:hypothetical protein
MLLRGPPATQLSTRERAHSLLSLFLLRHHARDRALGPHWRAGVNQRPRVRVFVAAAAASDWEELLGLLLIRKKGRRHSLTPPSIMTCAGQARVICDTKVCTSSDVCEYVYT